MMASSEPPLARLLNKFKVPAPEQGELLKIIGSLEPDIDEKP